MMEITPDASFAFPHWEKFGVVSFTFGHLELAARGEPAMGDEYRGIRDRSGDHG